MASLRARTVRPVVRTAALGTGAPVASASRQYPDPAFIAEVKAAFPAKAVADPEEVRVLYSEGYNWLDVRPTVEFEDQGKMRNAVNVPILKTIRKLETVNGKMERIIEKIPNPEFVAQVSKKFPKKDTPIMIGCLDGKTYSIEALVQLDEAGYTSLVGILGGWDEVSKTFTPSLMRK
eukprot:gene1540-32920_t